MFWNGIGRTGYGFITDVCREQKVAGQVDYVFLSIKVAPGSKGMALHFDRR